MWIIVDNICGRNIIFTTVQSLNSFSYKTSSLDPSLISFLTDIKYQLKKEFMACRQMKNKTIQSLLTWIRA